MAGVVEAQERRLLLYGHAMRSEEKDDLEVLSSRPSGGGEEAVGGGLRRRRHEGLNEGDTRTGTNGRRRFGTAIPELGKVEGEDDST